MTNLAHSRPDDSNHTEARDAYRLETLLVSDILVNLAETTRISVVVNLSSSSACIFVESH